MKCSLFEYKTIKQEDLVTVSWVFNRKKRISMSRDLNRGIVQRGVKYLKDDGETDGYENLLNPNFLHKWLNSNGNNLKKFFWEAVERRKLELLKNTEITVISKSYWTIEKPTQFLKSTRIIRNIKYLLQQFFLPLNRKLKLMILNQ